MPVTRSQATYNTRSTGRATLPDGIQQKKGKNVASNSNSRERPTSAQLDDHWVKELLLKIRSITFRSLVNEHFPWARDVLQRFRRTHPGVDVIFTVIVIIYIVYKIHNHPLYNAFCSIVLSYRAFIITMFCSLQNIAGYSVKRKFPPWESK